MTAIKELMGLPYEEKVKIVSRMAMDDAAAAFYDWPVWARPEQLAPDNPWRVWLLMAGRGFGKTRAMNELIIKWAREGYSPIAIVGQTKGDIRNTIVEVGPSSILNISPPDFKPEYEPSKTRLTWPNGTIGLLYSGDEPDQLRGGNFMKAGCDELAKYQYPEDTMEQLYLSVRVGDNPQIAIATTPQPLKVLRELVKRANVVVTNGHTLDNRANLNKEVLRDMMDLYDGTKLGRQELAGELLDSMEGLVYDAFDSEQCIIPRRAIPPDWPRYTHHDFGVNNAAVLWTAQDPSTGFFYHYRTYKGGKGISERVADWKDLSEGEYIVRSVGGSHTEQEIRDGYTIAGWPILEPGEIRVESQVLLVNELHRKNLIYVFSDLSDYLAEKTTFAWQVDKEENLTGKIKNESQYHYMACERYGMSEFRPVAVSGRTNNIISVGW